MKLIGKTLLIFCLVTMLLSSCQSARPSDISMSTVSIVPYTALATATTSPSSTPSPSLTATLIPTDTPSGTETPFPTSTLIPIPLTPIPTFDRRKAHARLPLPQAICPKQDPTVVFKEFSDRSRIQGEIWEDELLEYLNLGGKPDALQLRRVDVTGDGLPEILNHYRGISMGVYGCKDGKYETVVGFSAGSHVSLDQAVDINKNGIPELFVASSGTRTITLSIYEWNGISFRSLIRGVYNVYLQEPSDYVDYPYRIVDTNGDGFSEVISVYRGQYGHEPGFNITRVLGWDGTYYVDVLPMQYTSPIHRFQATDRGDRETFYGNYEQAFAFYHDAIFDDKLEWWTSERIDYELKQRYAPDPLEPTPVPDEEEYDKLAAYAYYRTMILHVYLLDVGAARADLMEMQTKFPQSSAGYPYVRMSASFWDTYASTGRVGHACKAAIEYAQIHSDILTPLGGEWNQGLPSHRYSPEEICPFS